MKSQSSSQSQHQSRANLNLMKLLFKPHPWHGIELGDDAPERVHAFVEIVPNDTLKYEIDKATGYLKVDRPQRFSNICPAPYGFLPQTYCGERIGQFCGEKTGRTGIVGDGDPLDICILAEKNIPHGDLILEVVPIGGLRMIDDNEADDKIIAVMKGDAVYGEYKDISDCPEDVVERLRHYFLTYKSIPGAHGKGKKSVCEITHVYGREEAYEVIRHSQDDYWGKFPYFDE
jgi:inorganic pyrophosphatase